MNPYFISEPSSISFSGGRTSAYMLYRILEAHDGVLPEFVKVTFANTGKEMPETLDFVRDCGKQWDVDVTWLELASITEVSERRFEQGFKVVDYDSASRNGEPYEMLIEAYGYLPNVVTRYCTTMLKTRVFRNYLRSIGMTNWTSYIGIRADEQRRAAKIQGTKDEGSERYLPLWVDGITKTDVSEFWSQQNFDLNLPNNNGVTDWGNCDLCFLKAQGKRLSIIRERPDLADWWIKQESRVETAGAGNRFTKDGRSYAEMKLIATDQGGLFEYDPSEEDFACFCGE